MTLLLAAFGIVHVDMQRCFMLHRDERVATAQPNHQQPATATAPAMRLPITSSRCSCSGHVKSALMPRPTPTATDRA